MDFDVYRNCRVKILACSLTRTVRLFGRKDRKNYIGYELHIALKNRENQSVTRAIKNAYF